MEALCLGDCIASICPEAACPHLADAGTSTRLAGGPAAQVSVVSFGELVHGVTLMGDLLLSQRRRNVFVLHQSSQGFVTLVLARAGGGSPWMWGDLMSSACWGCAGAWLTALIPRIKKLGCLLDWLPLSSCHPAFFPKLSLLWHRQGCCHYRIFSFGLLKLQRYFFLSSHCLQPLWEQHYGFPLFRSLI